MTSSLLGVVLCGGLSTRMGTDKAAMKHPCGGTFLSHSIDRMQQVTSQVIVVGTCSVTHDCQSVEDWSTENSVTQRGPILGVIAALRFAQQNEIRACLVTAVDTPLLEIADLQALTDQWKRTDDLVVATTIQSTDRQLQPLIAVYPTSLTELLLTAVGRGQRSLYRSIISVSHTAVELSQTACRNINTPDDYRDICTNQIDLS